jgi:hypothetical protein
MRLGLTIFLSEKPIPHLTLESASKLALAFLYGASDEKHATC